MAKLTKEDFTMSDEIDSLVGGDNTTVITGYVDGIQSLVKRGNPPKSLFKFILNNDDGKRIRIVMWEAMADTYELLIAYREIVRITRGIVKPIEPQYYSRSENIVAKEITVGRRTKIELLGKYITGVANTSVVTTYDTIELSKIAEGTGTVGVEGFIKVPFVSQKSGYSTHGTGAITDGKFKVRVHIGEHVLNDKLIEGVHIRVQGTIKKDQYGVEYLQVNGMNDITIIDDYIMPPAELKKGFRRSLKRSMNDEKENDVEPQNRKKKTE